MVHTTKKLLILLACLIVTSAVSAQVNESVLKQKKQELLQMRENMTSEQINDYYQKTVSRIPKAKDLSQIPSSPVANSNKATATKELDVPQDMIFPIESDEVQAIMIEWIYDTRTVNGNQYAEAIFENLGQSYSGGGYSYNLEPVVSVPDVASNSDYAKIFGNLANAIQKHAQVWIVIWSGEDSVTIKDFMQQRGTPLTNYRFFVHHGNSFWTRDWGPIAFYYGDDDSIAFMDFEYYGGRPMDDQLPIQIAKDLGWDCYTNTIEYEGGNILVDGLGSLFTTSAVYSTNKDTYGLYILDTTGATPRFSIQKKTALSNQQVEDSIKHLMNLTNITVVPALSYDGGTGHIDLYADMWEETGFVAAKYPTELSSWADAKKVENNIDTFTSKINYFGNNYDVVRVPLPTKNNGNWYSSGSDYNKYTRCWANHTFVNDAIIQPVFYDTTKSGSSKGNVEGNKEALKVLQACYPGYTFEEIDVRSFDGFGGAIHCITKQIPAENPVRIYHQPSRWWNTQTNGNTYTIEVLSQNRSGINNVKIYYKTAQQTDFSEVTMTSQGNNLYTCNITLDANTLRDTLYYYISSTSNNGKTINKPMTAHQGGYYVMPFGKDVTTYNNDFAYNTDTVGLYGVTKEIMDNISEIYPNPAADNATITTDNSGDLYYRIINLKGQVMTSGKIAKGTRTYTFNIQDLKTGNYWVVLTDGNLSTSRQLVVVK